MIQNGLNRRLGDLDAAFVYLENERAPMHVGSVNIYKGRINFNAFKRDLDAKIEALPRYRQRLEAAPLHLAHPSWEFDPNFDIKNHVHLHHLNPPGDEAQLRRLANRLLSKRLDPGIPLWEQHIIHGLKGGNSAMLSKIHHCLVDGVSAVELSEAIHALAPSRARKPSGNPPPPPPASTGTRTVEALWDNLPGAIQRVRDMRRSFAAFRGAFSAHRVETLREAGAVLGRFLGGMHRLPFNVHRLSGKKRFVWSTFSFAEVRAIRGALGGTVNDVVLTVLGEAMHQYLRAKKIDPEGLQMNVMAPVSLRREEQRGLLGNQVSMLPVRLSLGAQDPVDRFKEVNAETTSLKEAHIADALHFLLCVTQSVPALAQSTVIAAATRPSVSNLLALATAYPVINTVCTNVPGPQAPLFALRNEMLHAYPYLPVAAGVGVSFGVMSYHQHLYFTVVADSAAMPDTARMKRCIEKAYERLRLAAGVEKSEAIPLRRTPTR